jgi:hypothetical protein
MPRTGSKIYKNLINDNTDINISAEIFFLTPPWIREDVARKTAREIGSLEDEHSIATVVDYAFSGRYFGTFFRDIRGGRESLMEHLRRSDRTPRGFLRAILQFDAERNGKTAIGAKFPVHITRARQLMEWFPDARVIHLNRHPLAIYNSQLRKHLRERKSALARTVARLQILMATIVSHRASRRFHERYRSSPNYICMHYEDLVTNPEPEIGRLCAFLDVQFRASMLQVRSKDSSYDLSDDAGRGIHSKSLELWKREVWPVERWAFALLTSASWS